MKKVDFFNKKLANDVKKYVNCNIVTRGNVHAKYAGDINDKMITLENLQKDLENAIYLDKSQVRDLQEMIDKTRLQLEDILTEKNNALLGVKNYKMPRFFEGYKKALQEIKNEGGSLEKAIIDLFKGYSVDVQNTYVLHDVLKYCIAYDGNIKNYAKSDGKAILSLNIDKTLKNTIYYTFECMVKKGAIKPTGLNKIALDYYNPIVIESKKNKNKKAVKTTA